MTTVAATSRDLFAGIMTLVVLMANAATAAPTPDFNRDVAPILERRCVSCHHGDMPSGQLRLDVATAIMRGGESGEKIVNVALEDNELWRRVAGQGTENRMPPEGPPLDAADLAVLERWARDGAQFPTSKLPVAAPGEESPWLLWLVLLVPELPEPWVERVQRLRADYGSVLYLTLLLLVVIVMAEKVKRQSKGPARFVELLRTYATPAAYRWLAVGIAAWSVWLHVAALHAREDVLAGRVAALESEAKKFTTPPVESLDDIGPSRPKHPPRLGGTYYRGNDERSPALFNGGYYRTATMHVALCDGDGRQLAWGDTFPTGDAFIRVEIERPPKATPTLFSPTIMAQAFLSPCRTGVETDDLASLSYPFETLEPGERWAARFPLDRAAANTATDRSVAGDLFLYVALPNKNIIREQPHYGIRYRIVVKGGVIQTGSEVWMGSLLHLAKLLYPPPEKIVPNEWFDFREIPVIVGSNSTDPELLGVEEHRSKLKK